MTATIVQTWHGSASGGAVSVTGMTGITSGNLLVAVLFEDSDGAFASMTTPTTTYNEIYSSVAVSTASGFGKVFTRTATGSEPTSLSWPGNTNSTNMVYIAEVSGYNTSTPFAAAASWSRPAPAGVTSLIAPSVTPSQTGCLFCGYNEMGVSSGSTLTKASGMTGTSFEDPANFMVSLIATLGSVAASATGTKTAVASSGGSTGSAGYLTVSFVIGDSVGAFTGAVTQTDTVSNTVTGVVARSGGTTQTVTVGNTVTGSVSSPAKTGGVTQTVTVSNTVTGTASNPAKTGTVTQAVTVGNTVTGTVGIPNKTGDIAQTVTVGSTVTGIIPNPKFGTITQTDIVSGNLSGNVNVIAPGPLGVSVRDGSILVPLTVRIQTSRRDSDITKQLSNLTFRSVIPGGYASLTLILNRPLNVTPDDIEYFAKVYVYDGRSGETVWEGKLEDPGRGVTTDAGEQWSVTAIGPMGHTKDQTFPIIYVDQTLDRWHASRYSTPSQGKVDIGVDLPDPGGTVSTSPIPCIMLHVDEGTAVSTSWAADVIYRSIFYAAQTIARIRCNFVCGGASSNYQVAIFARTNDTTADFSHKKNWVTTPDTLADNLGSGLITTDNMVSFRAERDVSSTTADNVAWVAIYNISIRCAIYNADGSYNLSTSGYNVNNIDPVEVVGDLLGRILTEYDGANATLIGSGVDIDQLAYPDGTTASDIFDDLATYDPNYYWAAWETNPVTGKYRFEYVPWPDTVRYDCDADDGFDSPGSVADLYNAVNVRWRDAGNRIRFTFVTQPVPVLDNNGVSRTSYIDLSDEMGSASNAQYLGENFLAEHQYPPNAGTLTIGRPILDNDTGRMVMPWEIVPGGLIRVRGVAPSVDALNPSNRDGVTVFRVISVEFDASTAMASLELDSYSRNITNQVAKIATFRPRKR